MFRNTACNLYGHRMRGQQGKRNGKETIFLLDSYDEIAQPKRQRDLFRLLQWLVKRRADRPTPEQFRAIAVVLTLLEKHRTGELHLRSVVQEAARWLRIDPKSLCELVGRGICRMLGKSYSQIKKRSRQTKKKVIKQQR